MIPGHSMTLGVPGASPNGTGPRCQHVDGLAPVTPQSAECQECREHQAGLVICLTCGWVACPDDSPNQHARAHYQETDHPLAAGLETGSRWRWCYVHQRLV